MKLQFAATALLAAAVLTAPSDVNAQIVRSYDASAPIQLSSVSIQPNLEPSGGNFGSGLVMVSFKNTRGIVVDEVTFGLHDYYGNLVEQYRDVGPFAPNTEFRNHRFTDTQTGTAQSLQVESVTFHDGKTWYQ